MELSGSQNFSASPEAVWDALHNASVLQSAAPVQNVQWSESAVTATVQLPNLGPISGTRNVTVNIDQSTAPSQLKFSLVRSVLSATGTVDITANGAGSTLTYMAVATVSGPLSAFEGMAKPLAQTSLNQFFAKFGESL
jgi:carbon monoxide dehydrogenase subunit G